MAFSFEDLKVYRAAINWNERVDKILDTLEDTCTNSIRDQLERASLSIPLNIAEGYGRWHKTEKRQFFWTARGSTFECVAILHVMSNKGLIRDKLVTELYEQLLDISKMLSALIRSVEKLKDRKAS